MTATTTAWRNRSPLTTTDVDKLAPGETWEDDWRPDDCPDLSDLTWWTEFGVQPWDGDLDVRTLPVDLGRTRAFLDMTTESSKRVLIGQRAYQGVWSGNPYQDVTGEPLWTVNDKDRWSVRHQLPLPQPRPGANGRPRAVRRYGDPADPYGDLQWLGIDRTRRRAYEASSIGKAWWWRLFGRDEWQAGTVHVWDLDVDWRKQTTRGMCAAKLPLLPMLVKPEELAAGRIDHPLHLVMPNYAPARIGPARAYDGDYTGHPIRCGELARLRADRIPNTTNPGLAAIYEAAATKGLYVTDRGGGRDSTHGAIRCAQDARIDFAVDIKLSDLEWLYPYAPHAA